MHLTDDEQIKHIALVGYRRRFELLSASVYVCLPAPAPAGIVGVIARVFLCGGNFVVLLSQPTRSIRRRQRLDWLYRSSTRDILSMPVTWVTPHILHKKKWKCCALMYGYAYVLYLHKQFPIPVNMRTFLFLDARSSLLFSFHTFSSLLRCSFLWVSEQILNGTSAHNRPFQCHYMVLRLKTKYT